MSARPNGKQGGVGEATLTDEDDAVLTDENGTILVIPGFGYGGTGRPEGANGGSIAPVGRSSAPTVTPR